jgi:hypothetical protein
MFVLTYERFTSPFESSYIRNRDVRSWLCLRCRQRSSIIEPWSTTGNGRVEKVEYTTTKALGGRFKISEH